MQNKQLLLAAFFGLWLMSCGVKSEEHSADSTKTTSATPPGISSDAKDNKGVETSNKSSVENNKDTAMGWIDVGGVKVRRNMTMEKQLQGNSYEKYDSYNSGGAAGGYSSEKRLTLCAGGTMSTYEQSSTTMNVEGANGNSASEESDDGTWQVFEDQQGNLFLKVKMKKAGEGFIPFVLKGGKLILAGTESYGIKKTGC